nr:hypothetical protein Iba_scaffold1306188CG0010 [Ipomoea batatas]
MKGKQYLQAQSLSFQKHLGYFTANQNMEQITTQLSNHEPPMKTASIAFYHLGKLGDIRNLRNLW